MRSVGSRMVKPSNVLRSTEQITMMSNTITWWATFVLADGRKPEPRGRICLPAQASTEICELTVLDHLWATKGPNSFLQMGLRQSPVAATPSIRATGTRSFVSYLKGHIRSCKWAGGRAQWAASPSSQGTLICELPVLDQLWTTWRATFVLADWRDVEPGGRLHLPSRTALSFVSYQY
jgi:hypothetical protein